MMFTDNHDDVEGEWQWPKAGVGKHLCDMENAMRCLVCGDFFRNPHTLLCGHVFCSECIRKHLDKTINPTTSDECPSCRKKCGTKDLSNVSVLADIVRSFQAARSTLLDITKGVRDCTTNSEVRSRRSRTTGEMDKVPKKSKPQIIAHGQTKDQLKRALATLTEGCSVKLSTDGDKEQLAWRHREFVHIHNAQLSSPNPMTLGQIVREVHKREDAIKASTHMAKKSARIVADISKGKVPNVANNGFADLLKKAKQHMAASRNANKSDTSSLPLIEELSCSQESGVSSLQLSLTQPADKVSEQKRTQVYGDWEVCYSSVVGRFFFFNTSTAVGQFAVPPQLKDIFSDRIEGEDANDTSGEVDNFKSEKSFDEKGILKLSNDDEECIGRTLVTDSYTCSSTGYIQSNDGGCVSGVRPIESIVEDSPYNSEEESQRQIGYGRTSVYNIDSSYDIASSLAGRVPTSIPPESSRRLEVGKLSVNKDCSVAEENELMGVTARQEESAPEDVLPCPSCTYHNAPGSIKCEICLGDLSQPSPKVLRSQRNDGSHRKTFGLRSSSSKPPSKKRKK